MARSEHSSIEGPFLRGDVLEITGEKDVHSALKTIQGRRELALKNLSKLNPGANVDALNAHLDRLVGYHSANERTRSQFDKEQGKAEKGRPGPIRRAWNAIPGWVKALGVAAILFLLFRKVRNNEREFAQAAHDTGKDVAKATKAVTPTTKLTGEAGPVTDQPAGLGIVKPGEIDLSSQPKPGVRKERP